MIDLTKLGELHANANSAPWYAAPKLMESLRNVYPALSDEIKALRAVAEAATARADRFQRALERIAAANTSPDRMKQIAIRTLAAMRSTDKCMLVQEEK